VESSSILLTSNEFGQITTQLPSDQSFVIEILSGSYEKQYYLLTSEQWTKITDLTLPLSPIEIKTNNETERLEQKADSELDSWEIRGISVLKNSINFSEDAKLQLDEIVNKMKRCENCKLEITAYSDSRGNTIQNLKKTEDQASTLKKWLTYKGVPQLNITTKGGGDSKILNQCTKGIFCGEKDHAYNNRFEIQLVIP
jgi:outer membrane protein OmpA-like peptidoglycan-associated protein